jgi:hypothetical protein
MGFAQLAWYGHQNRIRLLSAYTKSVPSRSCRVSFTDSEGLEHAVEVAAASVYEAAVFALAEFRRCGFADAAFGPATRLTTIRVEQPETEHTVSAGKFQSWLDSGSKSPNEQVLKYRLCVLL